MKNLVILSFLFSLTNCTNLDDKKSLTEKSNKTNNREKSVIQNDSIQTEINHFIAPIDIQKIKSLSNLTTTTGVLQHSATTEFCKPKASGFFGHYQLISKERSNNPRIGQLITYSTTKPENWKFNDATEIFVEIELFTPDIKVWETISVGTKEKDVLNFIGNNIHYKKGTLLYCNLGDYTANFIILGDSVNSIKVGKYCK